jgi:hypothetical protein
MNKPTAVNYTGTQTPYGTKHNNIEIGDASIDYRDNDSGLMWYNSPDTSGKYMIISAANDNGYITNTPLFWVCDKTDQELLRLVNGLPNRRGETPFTTVGQATDWLNAETNYYLLTGEGGGGNPTGFTVTITQSGSDVIVSASGVLNLADLNYIGEAQGGGPGGLGAPSATFIVGGSIGAFDQYSGSTFNAPATFGSFSGPSNSGSGDTFGVIMNGQPPYILAVPAGYTSNESLTSTMTFTNTSIATMGLTEGTYTYTWGTGGNADAINMIIGGTSGTSGTSGTGGTGGGAGWFFYSGEGTLDVAEPTSAGNAIFVVNGSPMVETFNPNKVNGKALYFNRYNSTGTDYATQFASLQANGGTLSITQNGNTVTYTATNPNMFVFNSNPNGFLLVNTGMLTQTASVVNPFVSGDPITLTFS